MINKKNLAVIIAFFSTTGTVVNAVTDDRELLPTISPSSRTEFSLYPSSQGSVLSESPPKTVDDNNLTDRLYKKAWSTAQEGDKQTAFIQMIEAAEQNHAEACFFAAAWLERGEGCRQNTQEALVWYEKSYTFGCSDAANKLGIYYEENEDMLLALEWYEKGALLNDELALRNLERLLDIVQPSNPSCLVMDGLPE